MRTNIVIDDDLLRAAMRLTHTRTKKEVVDLALRRLVQFERQQEALSLEGTVAWEGDLDASRRSRLPRDEDRGTVSVLVDTSVWIDLFRARPSPQVATLKRLLGRQELVIGDLILAEILQGIRSPDEAERVERALRAFPVRPLVGERIARRSAEHYRALLQQGVTVRKTVDCLIATWCIENQTPLLHADRDFHPFVRLGLREL